MKMKHALPFAALCLAHALAGAQSSPTGLWKTVDDETRKEKSVVRIIEEGGVLSGTIDKLLDPARQDARCEKCAPPLKDKPVLGMVILRNVVQDANDKSLWSGGEILDPANGKSYKVRLKPVDGGKALEVRGYIGMPLLGRTQVWTRAE
jgi:uncharacterized protein (DUF2147 family)